MRAAIPVMEAEGSSHGGRGMPEQTAPVATHKLDHEGGGLSSEMKWWGGCHRPRRHVGDDAGARKDPIKQGLRAHVRRFLYRKNLMLMMASSFLVTGMSLAFATRANADWQCGTVYCRWDWRITGKALIHRRTGVWRDCVGFRASRYGADVTCSIGRAASHTVTTSVSGTREVALGSLSVSVGYQVERTTTVTASYTAHVAAHHAGRIQWAPVFMQRYKVAQRRWLCRRGWRSTVWQCERNSRGRVRHAFTERYGYPTYRVVIN